jgi:hypothetical protein
MKSTKRALANKLQEIRFDSRSAKVRIDKLDSLSSAFFPAAVFEKRGLILISLRND